MKAELVYQLYNELSLDQQAQFKQLLNKKQSTDIMTQQLIKHLQKQQILNKRKQSKIK